MNVFRYIAALYLVFSGVTAWAQDAGTASRNKVTTFKVFGVCEQCQHRIEGALHVKGVAAANWNIDTKELTVSYDTTRISLDKIHRNITAVGHDTYLKKAPDAVYNALPMCCYYREMEHMEDMQPAKDTLAVTIEPVTTPKPVPTLVEHPIQGVVLEADKKGSFKPLAGATVVWLGTGTGTVTDENGVFSVRNGGERLVVSYAGYSPDTISVIPQKELKIILASANQLKEVKVTASRASTFISPYNPFRTAIITQKELFKAACCNLSESFETNPSVDVSYNDAVTGSKQIQLLGLAGIYTQLTVENLPGPRGLATALGLNTIPGTFIESIQLSKGTGSVANGYESIAGQINVELKKPAGSERVYANLYANDFGRTDVNLNLAQKLGSKWSTALLLHNDYFNNKKLDFNKDGFRDLPTGNLFSAVNRWSYDNEKGFMSQFGIKLLDDKKTGGQVDFNALHDKFTTNHYGLEMNTSRIEGFGKIGYVFPRMKYKSIGLQLSAFEHKLDSYYGLTTYRANQQNFYSNLIYQSIINTTTHKFRTGLSFLYDHYNEYFKTTWYKRTEAVPGAFFEYTYTPSEKFDLVSGIRGDHNSLYGWFITPRLNIRYEPVKGTIIRGSFGRGQRTANIFAENNGAFASSRDVHILASTAEGAYGLEPEAAWNKGISIDQQFRLLSRVATLGIDFFRNDFTNQVVVDVEAPGSISFYNLHGRSYSNSFQAEFQFTPLQKLDVKLAYRLFDVKTTYRNQLSQKPLTAQNRLFANVAYETGRWKFDYTVSYSGRKRLPNTASNPVAYQRAAYSPSFITMNAQVSRTIGSKNLFDIYLGGENLSNYYQKNAIVAASQPFSPYFDASMIWGPVSGRMLYAGMRFRMK